MRAQCLNDASLEKVYESLIDSDQASRWFRFPNARVHHHEQANQQQASSRRQRS
jgi:uncharacterized protein YndB with AHSA1/START domain